MGKKQGTNGNAILNRVSVEYLNKMVTFEARSEEVSHVGI